jgi:alcohol dehydrogenase
MSDETTPPAAATLPPFDFQPRTRVVFGVNSVEQAGELARSLPAKSVLLVTDPGIVAAGHAERVQRILESSGLRVTVFDRARENPTTECVEECVAAAKASGPEAIVGLGGGSAMDTAKGCNFLLTGGGRMKDYWGVGKASRPMLPFMAIPTTAGTGSECQSAALIVDEETHQKMACLDPKVAARVALLDPNLTLSQPERVTACTGMDAITHAVETAVSKKRNPLSLLYSRESFKLCVKGLPEVLLNPGDLDARGRMQLGAAWAGTAIENSMLGAAHAAANPLTARCGLVHGQAVGVMLPSVIRFNSREPAAASAYADLASAIEINSHGCEHAVAALVERLERLLDLASVPRRLRDCGVERSMVPVLSEEAARQWTAGFNPRPVSAADFAQLYEAAY